MISKNIILLALILCSSNANARRCEKLCDWASSKVGVDKDSCLTTCTTCEASLDEDASRQERKAAMKECLATIFEGVEMPTKKRGGRRKSKFCKSICNDDEACQETCKNCVTDLKNSGLDR